MSVAGVVLEHRSQSGISLTPKKIVTMPARRQAREVIVISSKTNNLHHYTQVQSQRGLSEVGTFCVGHISFVGNSVENFVENSRAIVKSCSTSQWLVPRVPFRATDPSVRCSQKPGRN